MKKDKGCGVALVREGDPNTFATTLKMYLDAGMEIQYCGTSQHGLWEAILVKKP